jgi:hypothetical protein
MEDEKPKTSHLVLKPKEVVLTENRSLPGDGNAISVQLIHQQNVLAEKKAAKMGKKGLFRTEPGPEATPALPPVFKAKEITPVNAPVTPDDDESITVHDILLENRIAEEKSGWGQVKRGGRRRSRRTRDFLLVVVPVDVALVIYMRSNSSVVTMVYGGAALTLFTSMLAWIMFVVMDDY